MPGDKKMSNNVQYMTSRAESRYALTNYSDNLYVYFANGVHMSWDLKKSECGS